MIGNALDHCRLADAAIAALAVMYRVFAGFEDFSDAYQASVARPQPLFRRRA